MLISELIKRIDITKQKIDELTFYLDKVTSVGTESNDKKNDIYIEIISNIFNLLDEYQGYSVLLQRSNTKTEIVIDKSAIFMSDVVILYKVLESKIELLTTLINSKDPLLNVVNLISKRDKLIEEKLILKIAIDKSDLEVTV